jgi:hypothetical protein
MIVVLEMLLVVLGCLVISAAIIATVQFISNLWWKQ